MIPARRFRCNLVEEPSMHEVLDVILRPDNQKWEAGRRGGGMFRNTGNEKEQMNQEQTLTGAVPWMTMGSQYMFIGWWSLMHHPNSGGAGVQVNPWTLRSVLLCIYNHSKILLNKQKDMEIFRTTNRMKNFLFSKFIKRVKWWTKWPTGL